jgi:beta-galactosidase/beta-glucuronidase
MKELTLTALLAFSLAAAELPRPEYPQPQFQRDEWLNLNGTWEFEFDDANAGLDGGWASGAKEFSKTILVPFCFESLKSGIGDPSFHPWVWYRRSVDVPSDWQGRRVLLRFGAVDYRATVWVNGRLAGEHEGGTVPFSFDITPLVKPGPAVVTVRAEDPPTDRSIPRGKQFWEPKSHGIFYKRTSGIWQTVWLEAVGDSYLENVRTTANIDGTLLFEARVARPRPGMVVRALVREAERPEPVVSATGKIENGRAAVQARVEDPKLWSAENPNLYDVKFEVRQGDTVLDHVDSYFGFRSVSTEHGRVTINGKPVYLKFVLDQGYWPETNLTPPSDEAIQYDIRMTKEMGFNGARKHQKVEDPRYLYWADRMGFLVSGEMAAAYVFDESSIERFTTEWMAAMERDYSHPSIIIWAPINESWGVPKLRDDPRQRQLTRSLYGLTRSLDGTRLAIDNEGWEHTDQTDLFAVHNYEKNGDLTYEFFKGYGKPGIPTPKKGKLPLLPGYRYNGSPFYLSEFGGIAYIPPGHEVPPESWGYSGTEKTPEDALARMRDIYAAIAKLPFAGICYTQLTDVEQEINGLMTYDRKPKFDSGKLREINGLLK